MSKDFEELLFDLESEIEQTVIHAVMQLGKIGDSSVIPALKQADVRGSVGVRYYAKKAIDQILKRGGSAPREEITVEERKAAEPISGVNLIARLREMDAYRRGAEIDRLMRDGKHELADSNLVAGMAELLEKEEDTVVQSKLVLLIGRFGGEKYLNLLARFLKSNDFRVVANTIEGLEFIKHDSVIKLVAPFLRHPDNRILANAAKCIWSNDTDRAYAVLYRMVMSDDVYYRDSGVYILTQIKHERTTNLLLEIFEKEQVMDVIDKAVDALLERATPDILEKLRKIAERLDGDKVTLIGELILKIEKKLAASTAQEGPLPSLDFDLVPDAPKGAGPRTAPSKGTASSGPPERAPIPESRTGAGQTKADERHQDKVATPVVGEELDSILGGARPAKRKLRLGEKEKPAASPPTAEPDRPMGVTKCLQALNSKVEPDRINAVKQLINHLEQGTDEGRRDEILLILELACSDASTKVREIALNGIKKF